MLSVITLTYQRHHLLEEAIHSFLLQDVKDCELVVINDSEGVTYEFTHPNVRIINLDNRFSSVGKKLEWGYKQCEGEYIYRLDDDDLLGPNGLKIMKQAIIDNPGYEIYRSKEFFYFDNNKFMKMGGGVNNGNCYARSYLDRIKFPELSGDEDVFITFKNNAKTYTIEKPTMIYRWGMSTYHISGMGLHPSKEIFRQTDKLVKKEAGTIILHPRFSSDHYSKIEKPQ